MQKKYHPQQRNGVTLIELLLVLLVMAAIVFVTVSRYQLYRREKDLTAVRQNIDLLFQLTNVYYHVCCSASNGLKPTPPAPKYCNGPDPNKTFRVSTDALNAMLQEQNLNLNQILINTSLVPDKSTYQVSAQLQTFKTQQTQKPIYQFLVNATLIPNNQMAWFQQILNASDKLDSQLIWIKFPSYTLPSTTSNLWIMSEGLRQFKESATEESGDDSCGY